MVSPQSSAELLRDQQPEYRGSVDLAKLAKDAVTEHRDAWAALVAW